MSEAEPTKVVSLRGGAIPCPGEPWPGVVEELERLLEAARAGEIIGIAVAVIHRDEATSSNFVGSVGRYVLGEIEVMKSHIIAAVDR